MKWTSLLAQGWTKIPGAQQQFHKSRLFKTKQVTYHMNYKGNKNYINAGFLNKDSN